MADAQQYVDGFTTLEGGVDSGRDPELIGPNQVAFAINATVRGSRLKSRPGFRQPRIGFDSAASQGWFTQNRIQGAGYYNIDGSAPVSIAGVGGKFFEKRMTNNDAYIHDITPVFPIGSVDVTGVSNAGQVDRNSKRQPKVWMQQADVYLIIQDGQSKAIIYDGATARRAVDTEVPVGTCMAYGYDRLVVANGNQIVVGDIYGGGTEVYNFIETTFLNEGGAFTLPAQMGNITGMIFTAKQDTATGQGILLVFAEKGTASFDFSGPRANWKSQNPAVQQVALPNIGATSAQSLTLVNGDVLFRAKDGLRSYRDARAEQQSLGRTPISYEINRILDFDTPGLLDQVSAVYFDNRYLCTVSPIPNAEGAIFRGLGVMDFTPVTSTRNPAPPCFDGLWTGIQPVALVMWDYKKGDRCFAFCTDESGNTVWEITKSDPFDNGALPIESIVETRLMKFASNPIYDSMADQGTYKNLQDGRIWIADLQGLTQFAIQFRPDQYPFWADWITFAVGSPAQTCGQLPLCAPVPMVPPQYRPGLQLPKVPEACDPNGSRDMLKKGFSFQFRIKWTGHAAIPRFILAANATEVLKQECIAGTPFVAPDCTPPPTVYYSFPISGTCSEGMTGGPVVIPYGSFTSQVSQADADSQAAASLASQLAAVCVTPMPGNPTFDLLHAFDFEPTDEMNINPRVTITGPTPGTALTPEGAVTNVGMSLAMEAAVEAHNTDFTNLITIQNIQNAGVTVNIGTGSMKADPFFGTDINGDAPEAGSIVVTRTVKKNGSVVGTVQTVNSGDGTSKAITTPVQSVTLAPGDTLTIESEIIVTGTATPDDGFYFTSSAALLTNGDFFTLQLTT